ncbi:hypothetical protein Fmac_030982 [Flemingia macrophylla]|uniref:Uncharacterized protein n=1 Tax=Flemingia macrophylla TaxID=520843 RepID=A0ABD1L0R4_9FABA
MEGDGDVVEEANRESNLREQRLKVETLSRPKLVTKFPANAAKPSVHSLFH